MRGYLVQLEAIWVQLEATWVELEAIWVQLETIWVQLKVTWVQLEATWIHLEATCVLGRCHDGFNSCLLGCIQGFILLSYSSQTNRSNYQNVYVIFNNFSHCVRKYRALYDKT